MAMLASKPSFPSAMGSATYQNTSPAFRNNNNGAYGSPTESEFSDSSRMSDTVKYVQIHSQLASSQSLICVCRNWDEHRVGEWLLSINCGQYVDIFKGNILVTPAMLSDKTNAYAANNITGENLMDMDPATLKEMGVNKIGDRVRIGSQAKLFRTSVYKKTSKRNMNRVCYQHTITHLASC